MFDDHHKVSKFLSYVLRHRPDKIGLTLDANGWAQVADLITCSAKASVVLTEERIREVVRTSDKQRFALSEDCSRIGFPPDDGLFLAARRARNSMQDLMTAAHLPPCEHGVRLEAKGGG